MTDEQAADEITRLRAELAAIKGQAHIGEVEFPDPEDERDGIWVSWKDRRALVPGTKLYALPVADKGAEQMARRFHETYERLAPSFGYETRKETREFDPASPNGKLMIAVCAAMAKGE